MLFKVTDLAKFYGGTEIFSGLSFQINQNEKVGLVGRNGAGKTTLFRIVTGEETPDEGAVEKLRGLKLGMLDQHVDFAGHESVHTAALSAFQELHDIEAEMRRLEVEMAEDAKEELLERYADLQTDFEQKGGFEYTARAESVLLGMGFGKDSWNDDTVNLSGGQKNRLGMVRLLLSDSDLLLLDEPTNHLDVGAVEWLENYLIQSETSYVVISHDRYFLDRTCGRIIELENGKAYSYTGNYSSYLEQAALRREQQQREYENQQEFISKTEAFIRKNLAGQKTKQAKSRRNLLERMERIDAPSKEVGGGSFQLDHVERTGTHVLTTENLSIGYDGAALASGIDLLLLREERLGVIGGNGTGKTTFLKTLLGKVRPLGGKFSWGTKTRIGYYSQQLEELHPSSEVIQEFRKVAPLAENGVIRSFLARFLFFGDDVFKRVGDLSGGEKGRLSLAKLVYSGANVLLLDEPTNHLDIPAREALEQALIEFPGTIIVVSHDRFFLDKIANRILELKGDSGTEIATGNYSEYHKRFGSAGSESLQTPERDEDGSIPEPEAATIAFSKNELKKIRNRISEIEGLLPGLEEKLGSISHQMSLPEVAASAGKLAELSDDYRAVEEKIAALYTEWEELQEKIG